MKTDDGEVVPVLVFSAQLSGQTVFTTVRDQQSRAIFDFFYQEPGSSNWLFLGSLPLPRIPPARAGEPDLNVLVRVNGKGNIDLKAFDPASGESCAGVLDARAFVLGLGDATDQADLPALRRGKKRVAEKRWSTMSWRVSFCILVIVMISLGAVTNKPKQPIQQEESGGNTLVDSRSEYAGREHSAKTPPGTRIDAIAGAVTPQGAADEEAAALPGFLRAAGTVPPREVSTDSKERGDSIRGYEEYRISWGDTLWRIAERYYGSQDLYWQLAEINRIADPHKIVTGDIIVLPEVLSGRRRSRSAGEEASSPGR